MTHRILMFGNSGAGKSTLARGLVASLGVDHLDLDTLAWEPGRPPRRRPLDRVRPEIDGFAAGRAGWVVEGCYADLLELLAADCSCMVFLNPGTAACVDHCRSRPWEPHKYPSKQAQDANLDMLIDWVRAYPTRDDEFSLSRHRALFDGFAGTRIEFAVPVDAAALLDRLRDEPVESG